ncbi:nucleopolyhedrovirus P10 family protein [Streptomyces sp. NPDC002920]
MDGWTSVVRHQLGIGRLLPLGGARDGAWITEEAARDALREAVSELPGVRLGALRVGPVYPEHAADAHGAAVPPPPSALPPGPLRVTADFAASSAEPLPTAAARVREALATAAARRLGLAVTEVDLRVTALLDAADTDGSAGGAGEDGGGHAGESGGKPEAVYLPEVVSPPVSPPTAPPPATGPAATAGPAAGVGPALAGAEVRVAEAARAVPGVVGTTRVLGRAVRLEDHAEDGAALPRRHARVEIAVHPDHRALDVAREVRAAVTKSLPDRPTVAVLVTAVR